MRVYFLWDKFVFSLIPFRVHILLNHFLFCFFGKMGWTKTAILAFKYILNIWEPQTYPLFYSFNLQNTWCNISIKINIIFCFVIGLVFAIAVAYNHTVWQVYCMKHMHGVHCSANPRVYGKLWPVGTLLLQKWWHILITRMDTRAKNKEALANQMLQVLHRFSPSNALGDPRYGELQHRHIHFAFIPL